MSYDLLLFASQPGETPDEAAARRSDKLPSTPPDAAVEAQKHRLAVALIHLNPRLSHTPFDHEEMARFDRITVEEARLRYRHIELNGPPAGYAVQAAIHDDEVIVSVPCWHAGAQARAAFLEAWSYLQVVSRETGYLIYDPQTERFVSVSKDFTRVLRHYLQVVEAMKRDRKPMPPAPKLEAPKPVPSKRDWIEVETKRALVTAGC